MSKLDQDLLIVEFSRKLGASDHTRPTERILGFCRRLVAGWVAEAGGVGTIRELEELVCRRLNLEIEEFQFEGELDQIVRRRVEEGDPVFAGLPDMFDEETYAALIQCRAMGHDNRPKYVAVIDCRGQKSHRRWFSRWHEIAHLLTVNAPSQTQPVHRSTFYPSSVERLMDLIAADMGFYEPLFDPVVKAQVLNRGHLDFEVIERVRRLYAPEASFQATALACIRRWPAPAAHVEAGLALTSAEERLFEREVIPARRPTPKLRVLRVSGNDVAQKLGLPRVRNMRVPETSILYELFFARESINRGAQLMRMEDLADWRRSDGSGLSPCRVQIEARPGVKHIEALVQAV